MAPVVLEETEIYNKQLKINSLDDSFGLDSYKSLCLDLPPWAQHCALVHC